MVGETENGSPQITFLEVNTRLQVEHPVTEQVTGLDLVEWQLRVAGGEPLPRTQGDISFTGSAIEVRLVAEDPAAGWLPSVGTLTHFEIEGAGVRVDTGFRAGSTVAAEYDSLLAKVIVHDADRTVAATRLARALRGGCITGVRTNAATLRAILTEPDFLAGATPTAYLDEHPDVLTPAGMADADEVAHLVAAVLASEQMHQATNPLAFAPSGWRNLRTRGQRRTRVLDDGPERHLEYTFRRDGATVDVLVGPPPNADADGALAADARCPAIVRVLGRQPGRVVIELDGVRQAIDVSLAGERTITRSPAGTLVWTTPPQFLDHDLEAETGGPHSPLPGTVIGVHVEAGQHVAEGDLLMVVEAMKMEHRITAAADGVVTEVRFATGDRVDQGDLLVALDTHHES
jgi:propionyl-CoA carboxylase alpha chain